jgi:hypothetical protein
LDTESNFSPIGNQNLIEHGCSELGKNGLVGGLKD